MCSHAACGLKYVIEYICITFFEYLQIFICRYMKFAVSAQTSQNKYLLKTKARWYRQTSSICIKHGHTNLLECIKRKIQAERRQSFFWGRNSLALSLYFQWMEIQEILCPAVWRAFALMHDLYNRGEFQIFNRHVLMSSRTHVVPTNKYVNRRFLHL